MPTPLHRARRFAALVLLTSALPLSACSSGERSYCDEVKAAAQEWGEAGANLRDPVSAVRFVGIVKRIEAVAPVEVKADWSALLGLFETFTATNPDLSQLTRQMQGFETAAKRVEAHAKEACGVDLAR